MAEEERLAGGKNVEVCGPEATDGNDTHLNSLTSLQDAVRFTQLLYDMHTRVGLRMLHRLVQGVEGAKAIRECFRQNNANSPHNLAE
jgi:hypothetical protein